MRSVDIEYAVYFGGGDGSDWIEWAADLTDEEEKAYLLAKAQHRPFEDFPILDEALKRAYKEIEEEEISTYLCLGNEYVQECTGRFEVDPDEINELVAARDPYTLKFFGLEGKTDEELDNWDALIDVEELPNVCDFDKDYDPCSPFDSGWTLRIRFTEDPQEEMYIEDEEDLRVVFPVSVDSGDIDVEVDLSLELYAHLEEYLDENDEDNRDDFCDAEELSDLFETVYEAVMAALTASLHDNPDAYEEVFEAEEIDIEDEDALRNYIEENISFSIGWPEL